MKIYVWDWIKWGTATLLAGLTLLIGLSSRIDAKLYQYETKEVAAVRDKANFDRDQLMMQRLGTIDGKIDALILLGKGK